MAGFSLSEHRGSVAFTRDAETLTLPATWCRVRNLAALWVAGDHEFDDLRLADSPGEIHRPAIQLPLTAPLGLIVRSDVQHDDATPSGTPSQVLEANVTYLSEFCTTGEAFSSTITMPSGAERTADVHLTLRVEPDGTGPNLALAVLLVRVPAGKYVEES